jgi:hypothetical protein
MFIRTFTEEQLKEIIDLVELVSLYKQDGFGRGKIWKELRDAGASGNLIQEAFRRLGML